MISNALLQIQTYRAPKVNVYPIYDLRGTAKRNAPARVLHSIRRQLQEIDSNIHQIARKANALAYIDAPMYQRDSEKRYKFYFDFYGHYVLPEKVDVKSTV